jgi:murein DD-endopeptidase MepM/ murein hydrolase activator NlpD
MEGVGEMNSITRKRINIKRKEQFNKKLAFQVIFSIVLVIAVIITKQLDTDFSKQFLSEADKKMSENIEANEVGNSIRDFMTGLINKLPFMSKEASQYAAPVNGRIYMKYGLNKEGESSYYNHGLDIISNTQSVRSISGGKVTQIGNNEKLSNYVVIEEDGRTIIYGKINQAFVNKGDKVSKGDIIGALDEENMLLHIEVWEDGESINPTKLFKLNE